MKSTLFLQELCILLCTVLLCQSKPIHPVDFAKQTCKHNRSGKKVEWKECVKDEIPEYADAVHAQFEEKLHRNDFDDAYLRLLPNDFQCFSVHMYDVQSMRVPECPAVCKLKDSDEEKDQECGEDDLLVSTEGAVSIVSPRYDCGLQYRKKEICMYNISLPCGTDDVVISAGLSNLNLAEKDFLDIIDYSQKHTYERITQSLSRDLRVRSSQFVVLFSSSKSDKASGNGFNLHMECAVKPTVPGEEETEQGSAASGSGRSS